MKDFLVAMVIFRNASPWKTNFQSIISPIQSPTISSAIPSSSSPDLVPSLINTEDNDNNDIIQFYFNLFDLNHVDEIGLDELKLVLRCFCSSYSIDGGGMMMEPPTEEEIDELFQSMQKNKNDKINYHEFQKFYENLMNLNSRKYSKR